MSQVTEIIKITWFPDSMIIFVNQDNSVHVLSYAYNKPPIRFCLFSTILQSLIKYSKSLCFSMAKYYTLRVECKFWTVENTLAYITTIKLAANHNPYVFSEIYCKAIVVCMRILAAGWEASGMLESADNGIHCDKSLSHWEIEEDLHVAYVVVEKGYQRLKKTCVIKVWRSAVDQFLRSLIIIFLSILTNLS